MLPTITYELEQKDKKGMALPTIHEEDDEVETKGLVLTTIISEVEDESEEDRYNSRFCKGKDVKLYMNIVYGLVLGVPLACGLIVVDYTEPLKAEYVRVSVFACLFVGEVANILWSARENNSMFVSIRVICYMFTNVIPCLVVGSQLWCVLVGVIMLVAGGIFSNQLWSITKNEHTNIVQMASNLMTAGMFSFIMAETDQVIIIMWFVVMVVLIESVSIDDLMILKAVNRSKRKVFALIRKGKDVEDLELAKYYVNRDYHIIGIMYLGGMVTTTLPIYENIAANMVIFFLSTLLGNVLCSLFYLRPGFMGPAVRALWTILMIKAVLFTHLPWILYMVTDEKYTWLLVLNITNGLSWGILQSMCRCHVTVNSKRRLVSVFSVFGMLMGSICTGFFNMMMPTLY